MATLQMPTTPASASIIEPTVSTHSSYASEQPPHQTAASDNSDPKSRLKQIVLAEGLIGSFLILGAPFIGEHFEQYGGSKTIAIIFAVFHYVFHIAGGAILFKTGVDWGKLHNH